jgi:hypothetical protein
VGDGRVVVFVALPLRWTVGVRGVGEILVGVGQIELEECGGVVGEWTGREEGDVADGMDGARCRGQGQVRVRRGGGDCVADQRGQEGGEGRTVEEGGGAGRGIGEPVGEDVVEGGEEVQWTEEVHGGDGEGTIMAGEVIKEVTSEAIT